MAPRTSKLSTHPNNLYNILFFLVKLAFFHMISYGAGAYLANICLAYSPKYYIFFSIGIYTNSSITSYLSCSVFNTQIIFSHFS